MVVVAGWLILRWLHQKLWPKVLEPTTSLGGVQEISDIGVGGAGARREFDLMLAPPGRLRRSNFRAAGAYTSSLQNAENELRRRNEEEKRWRRTKREGDAEKNYEWREKELVRLQAEVESLEAVVEMRGEEVRRLRKQLEGREREEEEEVEMMWERVSKVVMTKEGEVEEAKVREASTQTEGAPTFLSQSQGTETAMEDDFQPQKSTKAGEETEAAKQDEIKGCENVRRSKEVGRRGDEDRFSLESGYFTHSDEETSSISSSPVPNQERKSLILNQKSESPVLNLESESIPKEDNESLHSSSPSEYSQITCDKDASQISDPTPYCDREEGLGIENKPKKSPVHERRPSRFLI